MWASRAGRDWRATVLADQPAAASQLSSQRPQRPRAIVSGAPMRVVKMVAVSSLARCASAVGAGGGTRATPQTMYRATRAAPTPRQQQARVRLCPCPARERSAFPAAGLGARRRRWALGRGPAPAAAGGRLRVPGGAPGPPPPRLVVGPRPRADSSASALPFFAVPFSPAGPEGAGGPANRPPRTRRPATAEAPHPPPRAP